MGPSLGSAQSSGPGLFGRVRARHFEKSPSSLQAWARHFEKGPGSIQARGGPSTEHAQIPARSDTRSLGYPLARIIFWGARRARYSNLHNSNMFVLARYSNFDARRSLGTRNLKIHNIKKFRGNATTEQNGLVLSCPLVRNATTGQKRNSVELSPSFLNPEKVTTLQPGCGCKQLYTYTKILFYYLSQKCTCTFEIKMTTTQCSKK